MNQGVELRNKGGMTSTRSVLMVLLQILLFLLLVMIAGGLLWTQFVPEQSKDMRNVQRRTDVSNISNALYWYILKHNGIIPDVIETYPKPICAQGRACPDGLNLVFLVDDSKEYLSELPRDPHVSVESYITGYQAYITSSNRIVVFAPLAEGGVIIQSIR